MAVNALSYIGLNSDKALEILKTLYQPFITKFPRIIGVVTSEDAAAYSLK